MRAGGHTGRSMVFRNLFSSNERQAEETSAIPRTIATW